MAADFRSSLKFFITAVFASLALIAPFSFAWAAETREARVTALVRDVRLLPSHAASRPAALNDNVTSGTAVRTGAESRAELTFADQTLTRLGANTLFSFAEGARTIDLGSGAILLCVPKNGGTAVISTTGATAAVTGGIALLESHPKSTNTWNKFIVVEGRGTMRFNKIPAEPCVLHSGQMIMWQRPPTTCPQILNIDLSKLMNGRLFTFHKLPNWVWDLIRSEINKQQTGAPPGGGYIDPTGLDVRDQEAATAKPESVPRPRSGPPGD